MRELARLAGDGAKLIWKRSCRQPGHKKDPTYQGSLRDILNRSNVQAGTEHLVPFVGGRDLPWYWARQVDDDLLIFFAHPLAKDIRYPMPYGFASSADAVSRHVNLRWNGRDVPIELQFDPQESLILLVSAQGAVQRVDVRWR
jgi:hypothetical protein